MWVFNKGFWPGYTRWFFNSQGRYGPKPDGLSKAAWWRGWTVRRFSFNKLCYRKICHSMHVIFYRWFSQRTKPPLSSGKFPAMLDIRGYIPIIPGVVPILFPIPMVIPSPHDIRTPLHPLHMNSGSRPMNITKGSSSGATLSFALRSGEGGQPRCLIIQEIASHFRTPSFLHPPGNLKSRSQTL